MYNNPNTPIYSGGYYRPNNNYAQRLNALEQQYYQMQPQAQPIQTMNQPQLQASCYFVNSPDELGGVNLMPNNLYLGINQNTKEIYVRRMDNNGITQIETYTLSDNKEEKTDYKLILEQLTAINEKLKENEDVRTITKPVDAGKTPRASTNEPF